MSDEHAKPLVVPKSVVELAHLAAKDSGRYAMTALLIEAEGSGRARFTVTDGRLAAVLTVTDAHRGTPWTALVDAVAIRDIVPVMARLQKKHRVYECGEITKELCGEGHNFAPLVIAPGPLSAPARPWLARINADGADNHGVILSVGGFTMGLGGVRGTFPNVQSVIDATKKDHERVPDDEEDAGGRIHLNPELLETTVRVMRRAYVGVSRHQSPRLRVWSPKSKTGVVRLELGDPDDKNKDVCFALIGQVAV